MVIQATWTSALESCACNQRIGISRAAHTHHNSSSLLLWIEYCFPPFLGQQVCIERLLWKLFMNFLPVKIKLRMSDHDYYHDHHRHPSPITIIPSYHCHHCHHQHLHHPLHTSSSHHPMSYESSSQVCYYALCCADGPCLLFVYVFYWFGHCTSRFFVIKKKNRCSCPINKWHSVGYGLVSNHG